jgi:YD repeat-containing protein
MNRLVAKVPDARRGEPSVTFAYNVLGLRTNMTDASGVTSYQYDNRNRLVQKTRTWNVGQASSLSVSLNYSYDPNGNLTNIVSSDPNGVNVSYEYDELSRLRAVNDAATCKWAAKMYGLTVSRTCRGSKKHFLRCLWVAVFTVFQPPG